MIVKMTYAKIEAILFWLRCIKVYVSCMVFSHITNDNICNTINPDAHRLPWHLNFAEI